MPKIASNFELGSAQPIDSRLVVENESNLSSLITYEGLEVYIKSLKTKKIYKNNTWVDILNTKEEVEEIVDNFKTDEFEPFKNEVETKLAKLATKEEMSTAFEGFGALLEEDYYEKVDVDAELAKKANSTDVYTKTETAEQISVSIANAITKVLNEEV